MQNQINGELQLYLLHSSENTLKQEPVDLRVYNTTPEINHDAVDIGLCFVNIYPLKRDLSAT